MNTRPTHSTCLCIVENKDTLPNPNRRTNMTLTFKCTGLAESPSRRRRSPGDPGIERKRNCYDTGKDHLQFLERQKAKCASTPWGLAIPHPDTEPKSRFTHKHKETCMRIFIASTLDDRTRLEGAYIAAVAQSDLHGHHICTKHRQTVPVVTTPPPQTTQQRSCVRCRLVTPWRKTTADGRLQVKHWFI